MKYIKVSELAEILGCTKRNIIKHIQNGNIKARRSLNKKNRPLYEISIDDLPTKFKQKYYQQKGITIKEKQIDNEEEREAITLWKNIIKECQTAIVQWEKGKIDASFEKHVLQFDSSICNIETLFLPSLKITVSKQSNSLSYSECIFSNNLRRYRKLGKLTQKELATATKISYDSIVNYELGRREPTSKNLCILAKYFDVDPIDLLGTDIN